MTTDHELDDIASAMLKLESAFISSSSLGMYLQSHDEAEFTRITVEAKAIMDDELGNGNEFSRNLIHSINSKSGGYLGGPSLSAVQSALAVIGGAANHIRRRSSKPIPVQVVVKPSYVDPSRLEELSQLDPTSYDLRRLVRLLQEINISWQNDCLMAVAALLRATTDHVAPIFGHSNFEQVASNYAGGLSFKRSMKSLNVSLRNIADSHLHTQIRKAEVLPNETQVDFKADLDVLLAEIVRLLK